MLEQFANEMNALGIPYEFMEWTSEPQNPYYVGEYSEAPTDAEDGYKESTIILTGTTKGTWFDLEQDRKKIEKHFPNVDGRRIATSTGAAVFYYSHAFPVPTGEANLKRIQINIHVKEWRGTL